jgi:hypothetical protein
MKSSFKKVKNYLAELNYEITYQDEIDEVIVIKDEAVGIKNFVLGCAFPILIMEQFLIEIPGDNLEIYKTLLKHNREIIHGALTLDEHGTRLIFRDTLQLENLDLNELEGSINSLKIFLGEFSEELVHFSK